jgi:Chaperone of endosialidase
MKYKFFVLLMLLSTLSKGQWQLEGFNRGETTTAMQSIGIGNFGVAADFQSRLHVNNFFCNSPTSATFNGKLFRTDGDRKVINQWSMWSGENATTQSEKFRLYIDEQTEQTDEPFMGIRALTNGIRFETDGADVRMRINGIQNNTINGFTNVNTNGFVAITSDQQFWNDPGAAKTPYSLLHLAGNSASTQQQGYRPWMKDGITFTSNSDLGYIGPRAIQNDITEFVLAVTDNANVDATGPDDLVVRFLRANGDGSGNNPLTNSMEGLEIMRCAAGSSGKGVVGIGDEFSHLTGFRPQRRLHVHDPGLSNTTNAQLRLSQTFDLNYTDFRVTGLGNLYINLYGEGQKVGIEEAAPQERLDVNGNGRFQNIPDGGFNCIIVGRYQDANNPQDNTLRRLDLNNDPNTYLAGDGTWATVPNNPVCDWNLQTNGASNDLVMGYAGACNEGNVGIGIDNPTAKLEVQKDVTGATGAQRASLINLVGGQDVNVGLDVYMTSPVFDLGTQTIGIQSHSRGSLEKNFGGYFVGLSNPGSTYNVGLFSNATGDTNSFIQVGIQGEASNGYRSIGVYGRSRTDLHGNPTTIRFSAGVRGLAEATSATSLPHTIVGVHGTADADDNCVYRAIGVYGELLGTDSICNPNSWAGYFQGDVFTTGLYQSSDESLKTNVMDLSEATSTLMSLQPKKYQFNTDQFPQMNLPQGEQMGFVAQDLANVLPSLVRSNSTIPELDSLGNVITEEVPFLCVNYTGLIPLVVAACQEQQVTIQNLQTQLTQLQEQLSACCSASDAQQTFQNMDGNESMTQRSSIRLSNIASIVLDQNIPNPMEETTVINFRIDEVFNQAEIIFYNASGRKINSHFIQNGGEGSLTVFADDLSSGVYTYALIVDGVVIDTKKMVKK